MRYPNKTYKIPGDDRELTVTLLTDPINGGTVFHLDYEMSPVVSFGWTGFQPEECDNQHPLSSEEFLLDNINYPWAKEFFEETQLAEPTGQTRTWLKDKYALDTGDLNNWELSADPNSGISRQDYPVYRVNMYIVNQGKED